MLRSEITKNNEDKSIVRNFHDKCRVHFAEVRTERQAYFLRRELAVYNPDRYCYIIIDGADQRAYGLPHFFHATKEDRRHKFKVRVIGSLEHRVQKQLTIFTLTEENSTGASHIIEALHRVLNAKRSNGKLLPVPFLQFNNFTRDNEHQFLKVYVDLLVCSGVFGEAVVSFLPVGHTHEDIDQAFSRIANQLRYNDAHTMEELIN